MASAKSNGIPEPRLGNLILALQDMVKRTHIEDDLSGILDTFLNQLKESQQYLDHGICKTNFTEAAIIIQTAAQVYAKKIDLLWDFVLDYQQRSIENDRKHASQIEIKQLEERINRTRRKKVKIVKKTKTNAEKAAELFNPFLKKLEKVQSKTKIVDTFNTTKYDTNAFLSLLGEPKPIRNVPCELPKIPVGTQNYPHLLDYIEEHMPKKFMKLNGDCPDDEDTINYNKVNIYTFIRDINRSLKVYQALGFVSKLSFSCHQTKDKLIEYIKKMNFSEDETKNVDNESELMKGFHKYLSTGNCDSDKNNNPNQILKQAFIKLVRLPEEILQAHLKRLETNNSDTDDEINNQEIGISCDNSKESYRPLRRDTNLDSGFFDCSSPESTIMDNINSNLSKKKREWEYIFNRKHRAKKPKLVERKSITVNLSNFESYYSCNYQADVEEGQTLIESGIDDCGSTISSQDIQSDAFDLQSITNSLTTVINENSSQQTTTNGEVTTLTNTELNEHTKTQNSIENTNGNVLNNENSTTQVSEGSSNENSTTQVNEGSSNENCTTQVNEGNSNENSTQVNEGSSNTLTFRESFAEERERFRRYVAWKAFMRKKLENGPEDFDIHQYGNTLINSFPESNKIKFSTQMSGQSPAEVCKFFIASLHLANNGNIEFSSSLPRGELANDHLHLTLLNKEMHHEEVTNYKAPSEIDLSAKLANMKSKERKIHAKITASVFPSTSKCTKEVTNYKAPSEVDLSAKLANMKNKERKIHAKLASSVFPSTSKCSEEVTSYKAASEVALSAKLANMKNKERKIPAKITSSVFPSTSKCTEKVINYKAPSEIDLNAKITSSVLSSTPKCNYFITNQPSTSQIKKRSNHEYVNTKRRKI